MSTPQLLSTIFTDAFTKPDEFKSAAMAGYMRDNFHVPFITVTVYGLVIVLLGQWLMKDRTAFELKGIVKSWNLLIAMFSIVGASVVVPQLIQLIQEKSIAFTLCTEDWYLDGFGGVAAVLFVWSKYFELFDTVLLVLRKKEVILLHWYHHITVLVFCWHAYGLQIAGGGWFSVMNYSVHSIMYSYYFLMCFDTTRKLVRPIASFITALQIVQMLGGLAVVIGQRYLASFEGSTCKVHVENSNYALVMYGSYLVLFAHFFYRTYIAKDRKKTAAGKEKKSKKAE